MQNITINVTAHSQHKDITLLSVKGFLDTTTAPEFERSFQTALSDKKFNLIIDLKDVSYVSSAGWGIFVGEIKRIRGQKGDLFLAAMSPEVAEVFELLEFDSILKSFPDVEQAVQKGFGRAGGRVAVKAPAEGAVRKTKKGKGLEPVPAAEPAVETTGLNLSFVEPPAQNVSKKTGWFGKLFLPWKWF